MTDGQPISPSFPDDVDVAVIAFNARATLPRLLECVRKSGAPEDRIVVYDMASTDDSATWLARERPSVKTVRLDINNGPNPGRNLALRSATRPYLLLLDSDAYIRPDVPARLRRALDRSQKVGTAVPVVVHGQDPKTLQYASGSIHFICEAINPFVDRPLAERGLEQRDIGAAPGVTFLIDVAVARQIGQFDDRYFLGKDDGDFCHRLVLAGFRLVEDPRAVVEHAYKPRTVWLFKSQIRNRWHFLLKNYQARTLFILAPALAIHEILQFAVLVGKGHGRAWWEALRDLISWMPTLRADRRAVRQIRRVQDRNVLSAAPLIVRQDLMKSGVSRAFKRAYDGWLGLYWGVARHLIS